MGLLLLFGGEGGASESPSASVGWYTGRLARLRFIPRPPVMCARLRRVDDLEASIMMRRFMAQPARHRRPDYRGMRI